MQMICPCCHARFPAEAGITEKYAIQFSSIMASLPENIGPLVIQYISMFRSASRSVPWPKATAIADELSTMISSGFIERNGKKWPVSKQGWVEGLSAVIDRRGSLDLPLKNHGYLLSILAKNSTKIAAETETRTEEQRRTRRPGNFDLAEYEAKMRPIWDRKLGITGEDK